MVHHLGDNRRSTPLVNQAGHLVGMLSTHYPRPGTPPRRDLQALSRFGALAGQRLSTLLNGAQADGLLRRFGPGTRGPGLNDHPAPG